MKSILLILLLFINACTPWQSYDLKGSNDILIYEDNLIKIQRSTEIINNQLMISHLLTKKEDFSHENFSIEELSNKISGIEFNDSPSFYEACSYKKYWYKNFLDIPSSLRNLDNCNSSQIIYYFTINNIKKSIVINTDLKFKVSGKYHAINKIDTLYINKQYHIPQP